MERINTLLGKHLWLQLALSILCASALIVLLFPGQSVLSVVIRMVLVSAGGGIAVIYVARRKEKRAAGSTDSLVVLDRKLRKGDVPTDPAERESMRKLVDQRLHRTRHRVAALVVLTVLFCSVTALTVVTGGLRQIIGFSLFTVAFLGWSVVNSSTQHRRLRTMDAALKSGSPAPQPQPQPQPQP